MLVLLLVRVQLCKAELRAEWRAREHRQPLDLILAVMGRWQGEAGRRAIRNDTAAVAHLILEVLQVCVLLLEHLAV